MSLTGTGTRLLAAALVALLLFVSAFFVARGASSQGAPEVVREQPAAGSGEITHAPLRAIGSVPALPRAPRKPTPAKPPPPAPAPPPVSGPVAPPPPPLPAPAPPPPPSDCVGEFC